MNTGTNLSKPSLLKARITACALFLASGMALANTAVTLTASPTSTTLPDGQTVPMWGLMCGTVSGTALTYSAGTDSTGTVAKSCTTMTGGAHNGTWQPPLITVPQGQTLTITLVNNLRFTTGGGGPNRIPTSLVIVGQLGGGLGTDSSTMPSPVHAPQGTTWPGTLGGVDTSVTAVVVQKRGLNYAANTPVTIGGGGGTGATAHISSVDGNGRITGVSVDTPGSGYTSAPIVSFAGGNGMATATVTLTGLSADTPTFVPPVQADRVRSFGTEVKFGDTGGKALTWANLRAGTYLIESGTQPSIQGPMGLYGVLVVTEPDDTTQADPRHQAYGAKFDNDVALLLSEIDQAQNAAVDQAVRTAGFDDGLAWNAQPGACGDPSVHTCYPPAVNYTPLYYLVNGVSFDRTNSAASAVNVPAAGSQGNVLLRFVNAGLRMHVPAAVGSKMRLLAEDGNKLPGNPRLQSEVLLTAGKTYDVTIQPALADPGTVPATYAPRTYGVFDRALSLSTGNTRDGGMQAYINVAGGATSGTPGSSDSKTTLSASDKTFYCVAGSPLAVTDPTKGVLAGATGANGAKLGAVSLVGGSGTLDFRSNGTFTYTSPAGTVCGGNFTYMVNGTQSHTATIAQCDANSSNAAGCSLAAPPVVTDITFTSNIAARYASPPPGVMGGVISNPSGLALTAVLPVATAGTSLNPDGSFFTTGPTTVTFPYQVKTAQGSLSNTANATVVFQPASNLVVNVYDAPSMKPGKSPARINDYRWIIEEDRTFWIDPRCQINSATRPANCPASIQGPWSTPPTPVEALGYNFHTANMPVVAQGCVGSISCEAGQSVGGAAAVCDVGNGSCRTDGSTQKAEVLPGSVHLDPNKRYFISILPGDGVNPTIGGAGGPDDNGKPFSIARACGPFNEGSAAWTPGGDQSLCGHAMGGAQIAAGQTTPINIVLQQTPLPTAKVSIFVYQDDNPLNGENDAGGGIDVLAPNEAGLGGFNVQLFDLAGGFGDSTGQITYDMFNQPVSNSLAGKIDPVTGLDSCPITKRNDGSNGNFVGMIVTCPKYESDGKTLSPLAGQVVIENLYPGLYEITAVAGADRIGRGEEWLQTNTLDGGKAHEAFLKPNEPGYFQEFGPGNFHVMIGFANPKIINNRKTNSAGTGMCDASSTGGGGQTCNSTLTVHVSNTHMSRTPDQRTYSSGSYDNYSFTQCYVSVGLPDAQDFALGKCDASGNVIFPNMPAGTFKLAVFDQWNDIMLDGLVSAVTINGNTEKNLPVFQWRANLLTRTFLDSNGNGVSEADEPGLALVNTNIRYRDGSYGFFNNTDLQGYAGFNEVFPFMNWLVVETSSTRFKQVSVHTVYDGGGPVDPSANSTAAAAGCVGAGTCGNSQIAAGFANTLERVPLPADLRVPGGRYCASADCPTGDTGGGSTGAVVPVQPWGLSQGWQGLLGQVNFMEFGMKPFAENENGGISGHVIYASTRPFDDPTLSLQLSWEPGVPRVKINLYSKGVDDYGNTKLTLVDTTTTTSWDDWAQGFRRDAAGNLMQDATTGNYIPNMNCPGQDASSPFFATLKNSKQWLDTPDVSGNKKPLAHDAQFKCYDGWSQANQIQPAPYDGMYKFPSVTAVDPVTGKPTLTNCTVCNAQKDADGNPMLPVGKYVVEVIVPPGYELVKEEDKNILLGDVYIAPVAQQFAGFGNVFIMPDQAAVSAHYNANSPGSLNLTNNLGSVTFPRHEGDTGSIEAFWPCVGADRIVPDLNSLFPGAGQAAPFAGAKRPLCDRKEVIVQDQGSVLAKFYIFSSTHIAGHFTGLMTNDFASEFDPFSPQFGEKFAPPNLPVGMRDFTGNEVARVYADQWGNFNGLFFSTYGVNPPNPTGYVPQMAIACMNDPGPIPDPAHPGQMITDPAYSSAYSNFCYEWPFMPGFTAYLDTPVIPTQAFADGYNLPDSEYPNGTPAIMKVTGDGGLGPWVAGTGGNVVTAVVVNSAGSGYRSAPAVSFSGGGGSGASGTAVLAPTGIASLVLSNAGLGYTGVATITFAGSGSGAAATAYMGVGAVVVNSANGTYRGIATPSVALSEPPCAPAYNTTTCVRATGSASMSNGGVNSNSRRVTGVNITNPGRGYNAPPAIGFSTGPATANATLNVRYLTLDSAGSGFTAAPTVGFAGDGSGATATASLSPTSVASVVLSAFGSGYTSAPTVNFNNSGTGGSGASATASIGATGLLTITALGDKVVQNPNFSGPNANTPPYNQRTITRHYGFGAAGTVALVDAAGVSHPLVGPIGWSDTTITGNVPTNLPNCSVSNPSYKGANATAKCGQLVITTADGKQSIDAITVTIGGTAPWTVTPSSVTAPGGRSVSNYGANFGRMEASPIQTAIDSAAPGDLIIVTPGTYRENLIMWKPVRLQGVGAAATTVNADAHPAGKMDEWRRQVNCAFGLTLDGTPNPGNANYSGTDPNNNGYSCPNAMHQRVDRIPYEAIVGWDAAGNGNLAQLLQEPTLMGAYEGAGVTVIARGVRIPPDSNDFWGVAVEAGGFTPGSVYLGAGSADCAADPSAVDSRDYGTSNFYCNPSRIDGVSIINSSQGGGAIFIHGWGHNLEVANTRIWGNHGTLAGGINLGNGETPGAFINDGISCGVTPSLTTCPPIPAGTVANAAIPFQFNTKVHIHDNMIYNNASIGDALFSGTPAGSGAITVSAGADDYLIDHNWMAGNLSGSDGGGMQHLGLSFHGRISHNYILFNQSTNPTLPTNGGGLIIEGANLDRQLNGTECGSLNDQDCPPGMGEGAGPGLVVDANLILGNSAESGSGGGLRLQQINGSEVLAFPGCPVTISSGPSSQRCQGGWYDIAVTNNIIANNVAGWDGGGVSIQDSLMVSFVNNTVVSNDTTASAGSLFKTLGAANAASPPPGCTPQTDPQLPQDPSCTGTDAPHGPQPAGLVVMYHTPNLISGLNGLSVKCPSGSPGFGYIGSTNGDCVKLSKPKMVNNLFWQNRAFSVDLVPAPSGSTVSGTGLQSQQNLIAITPLLNQDATGSCTTAGATLPSTFYWDIGLRTDDITAGLITTANKLALSNSLYYADIQGVLTGSNNIVGGTSPIVAQYCNGARMPPEHCTDAGIDNSNPTCKGYNAPPGASETTNLMQVFVFNGIQPVATVDEGHNWLNLSYGPLTLSRPNTPTTTPGELLIATASAGVPSAAYSVKPGSSVVGTGATVSGVTPATDFFGQQRPASGGMTIGAVHVAAPVAPIAAIAPSPLAFGNVVTGSTATQTLTLSNTGSAPLNGIAFGAFPSGFSRTSGTCSGSNLNAGSSCTVNVQFAPTAQTGYSGTLTVSASNATVTGSPVSLSGTGVAPPTKPVLSVLDTFNRANANNLGSNWINALGINGITVNNNQAFCTGFFACALGSDAFWNAPNTGFGSQQAAAFTVAGTSANGYGLLLKVTVTNSNAPTHAIRVGLTGNSVTVGYTTNIGLLAFATAGTLSGPAATFSTGNTLTALVDANGLVSIWKTSGATTTFVGSVPLPNDPLWTTGGGSIGLALPFGARVDTFSGGTVP